MIGREDGPGPTWGRLHDSVGMTARAVTISVMCSSIFSWPSLAIRHRCSRLGP
jgi:hypothetical protein